MATWIINRYTPRARTGLVSLAELPQADACGSPMAGFKTHITTSTTIGVVYGVGAHFVFGIPAPACVVATGLCSISGMLPDLDSDSGVPVREMISLIAAAVPMLMLNRLQHFQLSEETMACVAIVIYCILRFGVAELFKRYTVHRGMWHSVPACAIAGLLTFLVVSGEDFYIRAFKTLAVVIGFMSHLVLDEIWSVKVGPGGVSVKRSFGTAIKFWSGSLWANVSTYAKLVVVALLAAGDPAIMERYDLGDHGAPQITRQLFNRLWGRIEQARAKFEEGQGWRLVPRDGQAVPANANPPATFAPSPVMPASAEELVPLDATKRAALPGALK